MNWTRANAGRLVLSTAAVVFFVTAILIREGEALATTLALLAMGALALAVVLPKITAFTLGAKGLDAKLGQLEERVERVDQDLDKLKVRTTLARFIADGDLFANSLRLALLTAKDDIEHGREPKYDRGTMGMTALWISEVRKHLRDAPELGEADAILWDSQGRGKPMRPGLPERFDDEIELIRERQDRLRELIKRFE
jgi:hypothetical protein